MKKNLLKLIIIILAVITLIDIKIEARRYYYNRKSDDPCYCRNRRIGIYAKRESYQPYFYETYYDPYTIRSYNYYSYAPYDNPTGFYYW